MLKSNIYKKKTLQKIYDKWLIEDTKSLIEKCKKNNIKIISAESLTAGHLGHIIATLDPELEVFHKTNIIYSNQAKCSDLGVKQTSIDKYSAVSSVVASEMIDGVVKNYDTTSHNKLNKDELLLAISLTGYAGTSISEDKKTGTVFIGTYLSGYGKKIIKFKFGKERTLNIHKSLYGAIKLLNIFVDNYLSDNKSIKDADFMKITSNLNQEINQLYDNKYIQDKDYYFRSGEINDELLHKKYGKRVIKNIGDFLFMLKQNNLKLCLVSDISGSDILAKLTSQNGSSEVINNGYIYHNLLTNKNQILDLAKKSGANYVIIFDDDKDETHLL